MACRIIRLGRVGDGLATLLVPADPLVSWEESLVILQDGVIDTIDAKKPLPEWLLRDLAVDYSYTGSKTQAELDQDFQIVFSQF